MPILDLFLVDSSVRFRVIVLLKYTLSKATRDNIKLNDFAMENKYMKQRLLQQGGRDLGGLFFANSVQGYEGDT